MMIKMKDKNRFKWYPRYWATIKMSDTHTLTLDKRCYNATEVWEQINEKLYPLNDHWCITIMRGDVVHLRRWVHNNELMSRRAYFG